MITLWLAFVVMLLVACGILLIPVLRTENIPDLLSREEMNTQIYRQRLRELEKDREAERITDADFQLIKKELDATLIQEVPKKQKAAKKGSKQSRVAAILFALVPAGSLLFYAMYSYDEKVEHWIVLKEEMQSAIEKTLNKDPDASKELQEYTMADFIRVLQQQLQSKGGDAEGWYLLGSTYLEVKLYEPANTALRKAHEKDPSVPDYGVAYAQTMLALNNGQLDRDSERLMKRLVADFPEHPGVKMVYGMAAFTSERFQIAIDQWEALLEYGRTRNAGRNDQTAREGEAVLLRSIALAKGKLAEQRMAKAHASQSSAVATGSGDADVPKIELMITVSDEARAAIDGSETIFVLAKAMQGPPMPLAAKKLSIAGVSWPLSLSLTDQDAMMPQMKLSSFDQVKVIARISDQGQPIAQSGDWFGEISDISTQKAVKLELTIGQQVP